MKNLLSKLKKLDYIMFACVIALIVMGVVFVKSAGSARASLALQNLWQGHAMAATLGVFLYLFLSVIDYRKLLFWTAKPFYIISLVMLVAVLIVGTDRFGGRRWLWFFQPSEVAKLAVIMVVAQIFSRIVTPLKNRMKFDDAKVVQFEGFKAFAAGMALLGIPAFLILCEPDLGTTLVLIPAVIMMILASRLCTHWIIGMCLIGVISAGLVIGTVWTAENSTPEKRDAIYAKLPLKNHQIKRLRVFISPEADIHGVGYNLRQSIISIGSGSLKGKGIGKGEQKALGYLPPAVSLNDFIFAVLAEEVGFMGSLAMLLLFAVLLLRGLKAAFVCDDPKGRLLAVGIVTLIFCHVYVNVAMNIGLMPITGLPLPFISAGRTFLIVVLVALGMLQSVAVHGRKIKTKSLTEIE